jgi:hypothetical protein
VLKKHRTFISINIILVVVGGGEIISLGGCRGFEPRVTQSHAEVMRLWANTLVKPSCLRGNAGHAPSLHYTIGFTLQLRKNQEKPFELQVASVMYFYSCRIFSFRSIYSKRRLKLEN